MKQRALLTLGLLVSCSGMLVWACGPDFPNQLLDNRSATLKSPPSNSFAFEAAQILPATDALKAVENSDPEQDEGKQTAATVDADAEAGEDVDLYAQGADRYRAGDFAAAHKRFSQVLALPAEKSRLRGVWAAYMLGETYAAVAKDEVGTPAFDKDRQAASKAFELARTRAVAGDADPQGLAVASFGEQAVLYLYAGTVRCDWSLLSVADPCAQAIPVADFKHAVALYTAQAGHGSQRALHSLEAMASVAFTDSARTAALIDGPVTQRVLVAYALSRFAYVGDDGQPNSQLLTLVDAVQAAPDGSVAGLDRLASALYAAGRYEAAGQLAEKVQSPLASWVKAKLALQKGDLPAAAQAYAAAAQAFPRNDDPQAPLSSSSKALLTGEQGVLALARGEYVEAMTHLYAAAAPAAPESASAWGSYFSDMEYLAERVLTTDELKTFVDSKVPASPVTPAELQAEYQSLSVNDSLRWLLARRLMREGRFDVAMAYFPAPRKSIVNGLDLRAKAKEYAQARQAAEHAWTDDGQARARYAAAVIARVNGMELIGYEQGPDYTVFGGGLDGGVGQLRAGLKGPYVSADEVKRFEASAAQPDHRFHYRYIAAEQAALAADHLPERSQAFAAVLCKAVGWLHDGPPDYREFYSATEADADSTATASADQSRQPESDKRAQALYLRYLNHGAYVSWAADFGGSCPEPDFDSASKLPYKQAWRALRQHWLVDGGALLVALGLFGYWLKQRRVSRPTV